MRALLTLVIERNPLRFSRSFNIFECYCTIITVDTGDDCPATSKVLRLVVKFNSSVK